MAKKTDIDKWIEAQKRVLDAFYPLPNDFACIGVTGTNGKSTVVKFIEQIFMQNNLSIVTCGTLGLSINGDKKKDFLQTSPSYIDNRKLIYENKDQKNFAFEVSSHSLSQERFYQIPLKVVGWTSFSQDHLDYHQTMESYFESKKKIVEHSKEKLIVPARDKDLLSMFEKGFVNESCVIEEYPQGGIFSANFNKNNFELALSLTEALLGKRVDYNLEKISVVPGRFQLIPWKEHFFIVDYAHTPDALKNICEQVKNNFQNYCLITVFGCGGDRDRTKRPLMAQAVEKYSDKVVLTSDNPRFEDPEQIVEDTKKGFKNLEKHMVIVDRKEAIKKSLELIEGPSVILVAGKGHENYLDIKGVKHDYSDERFIKELIKD